MATLGNQFALSGLIGKRVLVDSDLKAGTLSADTVEILKKISTGDRPDAEVKGSVLDAKTPDVAVIINTNDQLRLPKGEVDEQKWRRRIHVCHFPRHFAEPDEGDEYCPRASKSLERLRLADPDYLTALFELTRYAADKWIREGHLCPVPDDQSLAREWLDDCDAVRQFLMDNDPYGSDDAAPDSCIRVVPTADGRNHILYAPVSMWGVAHTVFENASLHGVPCPWQTTLQSNVRFGHVSDDQAPVIGMANDCKVLYARYCAYERRNNTSGRDTTLSRSVFESRMRQLGYVKVKKSCCFTQGRLGSSYSTYYWVRKEHQCLTARVLADLPKGVAYPPDREEAKTPAAPVFVAPRGLRASRPLRRPQDQRGRLRRHGGLAAEPRCAAHAASGSRQPLLHA